MADKNIIFDFKEYLEKESGFPAFIQKNDIGANSVPCWNITLGETWNITIFNEATLDALINVKVTLFVDIKNTEQALTIFFNTLKTINNFDKASGSMMGSDNEGESQINNAEVEPEIDDNNIMLSFPFKLKTIIQNTN